MAQNEVAPGLGWLLPVQHGDLSGAPVLVGASLAALVLVDADADADTAPCRIYPEIVTVSVHAVNAGGNSAVAVGDMLYIANGDSPRVTKKATGYPFGKALQTVASGGTATIRVLLIQA